MKEFSQAILSVDKMELLKEDKTKMKKGTILDKKVNAILRISADTYNSSVSLIRTENRSRNHAYARALAMFFLNSNDAEFGLGLKTEDASKILRKRSHTSVYYSKKLISSLCFEPIEKYKIEMAKLLVKKEFKRIDEEQLTK